MPTIAYQTALSASADLNEKLDELWRNAYSSLRKSVSHLQNEAEKLALEGDSISVRIHRALAPGDSLQWATVQRMRGVADAWGIFRECLDALGNHHSTARAGLIAKSSELASLVEGFEARQAAIRATYQELAAVANRLEKIYPAALQNAAD